MWVRQPFGAKEGERRGEEGEGEGRVGWGAGLPRPREAVGSQVGMWAHRASLPVLLLLRKRHGCGTRDQGPAGVPVLGFLREPKHLAEQVRVWQWRWRRQVDLTNQRALGVGSPPWLLDKVPGPGGVGRAAASSRAGLSGASLAWGCRRAGTGRGCTAPTHRPLRVPAWSFLG